jgi:phosphatidylglycerol---prolipoprotein diacylglyceryl transferase
VHPILFHIGSYGVPSWGVFLAIAFAAGIAVARRRAREVGLDEDRVVDLCMVIVVASIVGARILWVATHLDFFRPPHGTWTDTFSPFQSSGSLGIVGLSMLGGVALALASSWAFLAWRRMPVLRTMDVLAPSVALGEGITRIGCFLNGCCYGLLCDYPWAVRFPPGSAADRTLGGAAVHPTQLYASVLAFACYFALSWLWRRRPSDGVVFFAMLVLLGAQRIGVDFFRFYEEQIVLFRSGGWAFNLNQVIALALVAVGAAGLWWRRPRAVL